MFGFGKSSIDKAVDIVGGAVTKGMSMWDKADFKPEEKSDMFMKLVEATKSQGTSLRRGNLLTFIMITMSSTLLVAMYYNHNGMEAEYKGLVEIIAEWKIGWSFVAAVSFYYLTQFQPFGVKK